MRLWLAKIFFRAAKSHASKSYLKLGAWVQNVSKILTVESLPIVDGPPTSLIKELYGTVPSLVRSSVCASRVGHLAGFTEWVSIKAVNQWILTKQENALDMCFMDCFCHALGMWTLLYACKHATHGGFNARPQSSWEIQRGWVRWCAFTIKAVDVTRWRILLATWSKKDWKQGQQLFPTLGGKKVYPLGWVLASFSDSHTSAGTQTLGRKETREKVCCFPLRLCLLAVLDFHLNKPSQCLNPGPFRTTSSAETEGYRFSAQAGPAGRLSLPISKVLKEATKLMESQICLPFYGPNSTQCNSPCGQRRTFLHKLKALWAFLQGTCDFC